MKTKINNLSIAFICNIMIGIVLSIVFDCFSILPTLLFGIIPVLYLLNKTDNNLIKEILFFYSISTLFILLVYYGNDFLYGAPYYNGGSDDKLFEDIGRIYLSNGYHFPWDYHYASNVKGMYWLLSLLIGFSNIFGDYHTISFRLINENLFFSTALLTYLIYEKHFSRGINESRKVLLTISLFPNALYLSSYVFRDTIVTLLMMVVFVLCDDLFNSGQKPLLVNNKALAVVLIIIVSFLGFWFRLEVAFYAVFFFSFSILRNQSLAAKRVLSVFVPLLLFILIIIQLNGFDFILDKIERYQDYRVSLTSDNTNRLYRMVFEMDMLPFGFFLRSVFGLVTPLPTAIIKVTSYFDNSISFLQVLIAIGTCWQIIHLPFLFDNAHILDKFTLGFLIIFISIVISTFTFRHFIMIYPLLIILICRRKYAMNDLERKNHLIIGFVVLVSFGILYLLV